MYRAPFIENNSYLILRVHTKLINVYQFINDILNYLKMIRHDNYSNAPHNKFNRRN